MSGLSPMFSMGAVGRYAQKFANERERLLIEKLAFIGENAINQARDYGSYKDQTGNLRSSIGYVILRDGRDVNSKVYEAGQGSDRKTGVATGKEFIEWAEKEFKDESLVLVIFASMEYAAAVESKGYDVISSAVPLAQFLKKELDEV